MRWANLPFISEREVKIIYKDGDVLDFFRPDVIVDQKVVVEYKAVDQLTESHVSQILTYLKISNLQIGLLINFGERKLQFKRFINKYFDRASLPI
jgi:GxxExxY protein